MIGKNFPDKMLMNKININHILPVTEEELQCKLKPMPLQ